MVPPVISVSILTYNQREVIGRAIESVLAQRITVPYEIIVGDDYSDDGTQEVLKDYQARYPGIIQLILHPRRYGDEVPGRTNNITNLSNCRGKYTAMLDGDDYWTDPDKLQRQYDRMEADPGLAMCLHNSYVVPEGRAWDAEVYPTTTLRGSIHATGIYGHAEIATRQLEAQISTILFRTRSVEYFPKWFRLVVPADFALLLLISQTGRVFYNATPAAVYTTGPTSFNNTVFKSEKLTRRRLADVELLARHFPATSGPGSDERVYAYLYYRLWKVELQRGKLGNAVRYFSGMIRRDPLYPLRAIKGRLLPALLLM